MSLRILCGLFMVTTLAGRALGERTIPVPLREHPGNIFLAGENVDVNFDGAWTLADYDAKRVAEGNSKDGRAQLGKLATGYYELKPKTGAGRTTLGVLAPLAAPTPVTSPISIDVGMAWFYFDQPKQRAAANLCNLAGINWVRDRLNWQVMEPKPKQFAAHNIYDDTARIQTEAGLKILQVNHVHPTWDASHERGFPTDLRNVHRFYAEMARRWKGQVLAFEPWNEADISVFGGQTGNEMASLQKAAYLGLKEGNPDIIACQNVFAMDQVDILKDFGENEASAYFDTYNLHHYIGFDRYPEAYARHRAVSAGKPMWVTECNLPVKYSGDEKLKEPSDPDLRVQAERVTKVFATSLHEGPVNVFFFILGHYSERDVQFGLVHEDLTPRPGYVALAAAGRLLADARPLGKWKVDDPDVRGYLFRARPDGKEKMVLVAWRKAKGQRKFKLDAPAHVFDHLGRESEGSWVGELTLTNAPIYAVLQVDNPPPVDPPPTPPTTAPNAVPSGIVLQALVPRERVEQKQSAYKLDGKPITCFAYNFGDKVTEVSLKCSAEGVTIEPAMLRVAPGGREGFRVTVKSPGTVRIEGAAKPQAAVLSFRVIRADEGS